MTPEFAIEVLKNLMLQAVTLASPVLLTALSIGLAVSLFQAVTTIQEATLAFVPKALGVVGLLAVLLPWFMRTLMEFTVVIFQKMPEMAR